MKTISKLLVLLILSSWGLSAQNEANPWQITIGINAVNVYQLERMRHKGHFSMSFSMLLIIGIFYPHYLIYH